jgi:putative addiction module killer protein
VEIRPWRTEHYLTADNVDPFWKWLKKLKPPWRGRIEARITRIEEDGNLGDCEPVGEGVFELKFKKGPGYRIYFGIDRVSDQIVLLYGGDKSTQAADILKAKEYWRDYNA